MIRELPRYWRPLQRATSFGPEPEGAITAAMAAWGVDREEALRRLDEDHAKCEYWVNHLYQVELRYINDDVVQLNIRRRDGAPALRDWRHFQQIKNELVGPECEAVELYPAESRKVDTSNKYHLWACRDPSYRFPIGFPDRDVDYQGGKEAGVRQRTL